MNIPIIVGTAKETNVHFQLCVSFFIVRHVVEHGQWKRQNNIVETAVTQVQPFDTNNCFSSKVPISVIVPVAIYAIIMIGTTISFAGKPKIKAMSITPSNPISWANGSKNPLQCASMVTPPIDTFAISHIINPAGAAITMALPNTNNVRSKMERTITFPTCGVR